MINEEALNNLVRDIQSNCNGRKIVFYGKHLELKTALSKRGVDVSKIFSGDRRIIEQKDCICFQAEKLKGKCQQYYVVCPYMLTDGGKFLSERLSEYGYVMNRDFTFYIDKKICNQTNYKDVCGNKANGIKKGIEVYVYGRNNSVEIDDNLDLSTGKLIVTLSGNNNVLEIKSGCKFNGTNSIRFAKNHGIAVLGNSNILRGNRLSIWEDGCIEIGEGTDFGSGTELIAYNKGRITLGRDCMISWNVMLSAGDGHSIFDIISGENINSFGLDKCLCSIMLKDHVWVGTRTIILGGKTEIREGSIIGAQSVVKGKYPNNCVIAGCPARVVKKDVAWSRKNNAEDITSCGTYVQKTEEEENKCEIE